MRALHLENAKPCLTGNFPARERRNGLERPSMTLAPEAMHIGIHIFDTGMTVILFGKQSIELSQRLQKIRIVIMRDAMLALCTHFLGVDTFFRVPSFAEILHWHIFQDKIRKAFFVFAI